MGGGVLLGRRAGGLSRVHRAVRALVVVGRLDRARLRLVGGTILGRKQERWLPFGGLRVRIRLGERATIPTVLTRRVHLPFGGAGGRLALGGAFVGAGGGAGDLAVGLGDGVHARAAGGGAGPDARLFARGGLEPVAGGGAIAAQVLVLVVLFRALLALVGLERLALGQPLLPPLTRLLLLADHLQRLFARLQQLEVRLVRGFGHLAVRIFFELGYAVDEGGVDLRVGLDEGLDVDERARELEPHVGDLVFAQRQVGRVEVVFKGLARHFAGRLAAELQKDLALLEGLGARQFGRDLRGQLFAPLLAVLVHEDLHEQPAHALPYLVIPLVDIVEQVHHQAVVHFWHVEMADCHGELFKQGAIISPHGNLLTEGLLVYDKSVEQERVNVFLWPFGKKNIAIIGFLLLCGFCVDFRCRTAFDRLFICASGALFV